MKCNPAVLGAVDEQADAVECGSVFHHVGFLRSRKPNILLDIKGGVDQWLNAGDVVGARPSPILRREPTCFLVRPVPRLENCPRHKKMRGMRLHIFSVPNWTRSRRQT